VARLHRDKIAGVAAVTRWQDVVLGAGAERGFNYLWELASDGLEEALPLLRTDPDLLAAARSSSAGNLALVFSLVRGEIATTEVEQPPQAAAFTRELARRNVPVTELERAYRMVQRRMWRWGIEEMRARIPDPDTLAACIEEFSEASFVTGDLLSSLVMVRYAEERDRWARSAYAVRAATVQELLSGRPVDVRSASRRLRYELEQRHQAFVAWAEDEDSIPESGAAQLGGARALLVSLGVGVIAGWGPYGTLALDAEIDGVSVAVGLPGSGARGFRISHQQAMEARRVARTFDCGPGPVAYSKLARLALLTQDPEQARAFASRVLGPLAEGGAQARRLAETLFVVLEEQGSPRRAGKRLGVHENTIAKRLRAIDALLDPATRASPADLLAALTIRLAEAAG
jgi:hypothetical protein